MRELQIRAMGCHQHFEMKREKETEEGRTWGRARGGAPAWGARGARDAVISVLRVATGLQERCLIKIQTVLHGKNVLKSQVCTLAHHPLLQRHT